MGKGTFIATIIVMFILFLSWISIIFNLSGNFFKFEFILLIGFMITAIFLTFNVLQNKSNWKKMIVFFELNWINSLIIYFATFNFSKILLPLIVSTIGFSLALLKTNSQEETNSQKNVEKKSEIKKEFKPGKFIASKNGKKFHAPKCEWAKKINKNNQVWYNSKKEAEQTGKKACNCIN